MDTRWTTALHALPHTHTTQSLAEATWIAIVGTQEYPPLPASCQPENYTEASQVTEICSTVWVLLDENDDFRTSFFAPTIA